LFPEFRMLLNISSNVILSSPLYNKLSKCLSFSQKPSNIKTVVNFTLWKWLFCLIIFPCSSPLLGSWKHNCLLIWVSYFCDYSIQGKNPKNFHTNWLSSLPFFWAETWGLLFTSCKVPIFAILLCSETKISIQ
jgi:hypothetical protein